MWLCPREDEFLSVTPVGAIIGEAKHSAVINYTTLD